MLRFEMYFCKVFVNIAHIQQNVHFSTLRVRVLKLKDCYNIRHIFVTNGTYTKNVNRERKAPDKQKSNKKRRF